MVGTTKFGADGDFITAPELSSQFAACLAMQCAEVLQMLSGGGIVEFGGGSGRLACDLLRGLDERGHLPAFYAIIDPSGDLRKRQRDLIQCELPHLYGRVQWWDSLPGKPITGIVNR